MSLIYMSTDEVILDTDPFPKITYKKVVECRKPFTCHCGKEVHKNELYYSFKPAPEYNKYTKKRIYHTWHKSCYDCEPMSTAILIEIEMKERY